MSEMTRYAVHVTQDWVYEIEADSPEEAAQYIDNGEAPEGECTGYSIDAVTTPDDQFGEVELRQPIPCRGCAKPMPPSGPDECRRCLIQRVVCIGRSGVTGN